MERIIYEIVVDEILIPGIKFWTYDFYSLETNVHGNKGKQGYICRLKTKNAQNFDRNF